MYWTVFVLAVYNICFCSGDNVTELTSTMATTKMAVREVGQSLLALLKEARGNITREKQLQLKLERIDSYVIDKEQYATLLRSHARRYTLNETNFYKALQEEHNFLKKNESKNLYLRIKENMNRDDLLRILASRGKGKVKLTARRMRENPQLDQRRIERKLSDIVDKYLGETAHDDHNFTEVVSKYWDPQPEIEARLEHHSGRRIFRGDRTSVTFYPFMVSVHVVSQFWCGGSIVSSDLILTSASCLQLLHNNRFYRENPKVLAVRVGSNHSRVGGEMVPVMEVYFHPGYNPKTLFNNIAIARLSRSLALGYHRVPRTIDISHSHDPLSTNNLVMILGWGVSKFTQKLSYEPLYLNRKILPVYPNKFCKEIYGKKFLAETMFCAGTMSTGEGACSHDAGGPAILDGYLVGVISFGPQVCGVAEMPTVFTHVGYYSDWIETVNASMPRYYRGKKRTTTTTQSPYYHLIKHRHTKSHKRNKNKEERKNQKLQWKSALRLQQQETQKNDWQQQPIPDQWDRQRYQQGQQQIQLQRQQLSLEQKASFESNDGGYISPFQNEPSQQRQQYQMRNRLYDKEPVSVNETASPLPNNNIEINNYGSHDGKIENDDDSFTNNGKLYTKKVQDQLNAPNYDANQPRKNNVNGAKPRTNLQSKQPIQNVVHDANVGDIKVVDVDNIDKEEIIRSIGNAQADGLKTREEVHDRNVKIAQVLVAKGVGSPQGAKLNVPGNYDSAEFPHTESEARDFEPYPNNVTPFHKRVFAGTKLGDVDPPNDALDYTHGDNNNAKPKTGARANDDDYF